MLEGKKTYIVSAMVIAQAAGAFALGEMTIMEAMNAILMGLGLGTLRMGVGSR